MKISVQRDILSLQFLIGFRSVSVKHNMNLNKKTTFGNTKKVNDCGFKAVHYFVVHILLWNIDQTLVDSLH